MAIVNCEIRPLSGIPAQDFLEKTASLLLEPFLNFGPRISEGPILSKETGLEPLNKFMIERPNFSARGRKNFEALFNWSRLQRSHPPLNGSLSTFIKFDAIEVDILLEALINAVKLLAAPIGYIDVWDNGYRLRHERHMRTYQEGHTGIDRVFGDFRGFSGIPWKTVLGPDYVHYFGVENLSKLPSNLASEIADGFWLLTPCENHKDWTPEVWCEGEAQIIETLGADSFFKPASETQATRSPTYPTHSPLPIKIQRKVNPSDSGINIEKEWLYLNGYPKT